MESNSPEWHSKSEFYYPDEIDENINTGNTDEQEQVKERPTNSNNSWLKCMILSNSKGLKTPRKELCIT